MTFVLGDAHTVDFDENSIDVVYSHTAFHSFIDPIKALKAQRRVTKPGDWVERRLPRAGQPVARYHSQDYAQHGQQDMELELLSLLHLLFLWKTRTWIPA